MDTYLVLPSSSPATARRALEGSLGDGTAVHVGVDFVVLYAPERFAQVEADPELWGPQYAKGLPAPVRRSLDDRGILAVPEVGQSFDGLSYGDLAKGRVLWLPVRARLRRRERRVMLVPLSETRRRMLLEHPELVRSIVDARGTERIAAFEIGPVWIALQALLFDAMWSSGGDDARAEALTPRAGLPLYEDRTIEAARLVSIERVRETAEWLAGLARDIAERELVPSPASTGFPASLGTSEADDHEPARAAPRKPGPVTLGAELDRLRELYLSCAQGAQSLLAIRFRA